MPRPANLLLTVAPLPLFQLSEQNCWATPVPHSEWGVWRLGSIVRQWLRSRIAKLSSNGPEGLANSDQYSDWVSIESSMGGASLEANSTRWRIAICAES